MFFPYLGGLEGQALVPWPGWGWIQCPIVIGGLCADLTDCSIWCCGRDYHEPQDKNDGHYGMFFGFPYYIFDRTRNPMIATMLPGLLAWVFLWLKST